MINKNTTIAGKEKNAAKANWYMGAITDENSCKATMPLLFHHKGNKHVAGIYYDTANADWKTLPKLI